MKKNSIHAIIVLIISITFFYSCSNEDMKTSQTLNLSKNILKKDILNKVLSDVEQIQERNQANKLSQNELENQMHEAMQPMIDNGEIIHNEIINFIQNSDEYNQLSTLEQYEINNLTDEQLAELSFIASLQYETNSVDWERVRSCASFALGIQGIRSLYTNTLA